MSEDSGDMSGEFWGALHAATEQAGDLCDFVIACGDRQWSVHKLVLRLHGGPLAAACKGEWKEAQEGRIDLSSDPVTAVDALIQYLYRFNYEAQASESVGELELHTQVAIIADKYRLRLLKDHAVDKFGDALWDLQFANDDLAHALRLAYNVPGPTTDIRKQILERVVETKDFLAHEEIESSAFVDTISADVTITLDLAKAAMTECQSLRDKAADFEKQRFRCSTCFRSFVIEVERLRGYRQGDSWMRCPDAQCESRKRRVRDWKAENSES